MVEIRKSEAIVYGLLIIIIATQVILAWSISIGLFHYNYQPDILAILTIIVAIPVWSAGKLYGGRLKYAYILYILAGLMVILFFLIPPAADVVIL